MCTAEERIILEGSSKEYNMAGDILWANNEGRKKKKRRV